VKELRRKDRAMAKEDTISILTTGKYGVLSTVDEIGQPYGVPLNYVFMDECIYFHAAYLGHKIDNIANQIPSQINNIVI
jgi:nitroimidazol reductase NimA-like FMN-containing flavoprotein (pyridoxamine 5'-phosphate oxidase superfamily)